MQKCLFHHMSLNLSHPYEKPTFHTLYVWVAFYAKTRLYTGNELRDLRRRQSISILSSLGRRKSDIVFFLLRCPSQTTLNKKAHDINFPTRIPYTKSATHDLMLAGNTQPSLPKKKNEKQNPFYYSDCIHLICIHCPLSLEKHTRP